jgi:hypothetical protein
MIFEQNNLPIIKPEYRHIFLSRSKNNGLTEENLINGIGDFGTKFTFVPAGTGIKPNEWLVFMKVGAIRAKGYIPLLLVSDSS